MTYTFKLKSLRDVDAVEQSADVVYTFNGDELNIDTMIYHFSKFLSAAGYVPGNIYHEPREI